MLSGRDDSDPGHRGRLTRGRSYHHIISLRRRRSVSQADSADL